MICLNFKRKIKTFQKVEIQDIVPSYTSLAHIWMNNFEFLTEGNFFSFSNYYQSLVAKTDQGKEKQDAQNNSECSVNSDSFFLEGSVNYESDSSSNNQTEMNILFVDAKIIRLHLL